MMMGYPASLRRWRVSAKKGATVRALPILESALVATLEQGAFCESDGKSMLVDGVKERVHLVSPVDGWVTRKCLASTPAKMEMAMDMAVDETVVDRRRGGLESFTAARATPAAEVLWLDNNGLVDLAGIEVCVRARQLNARNNKLRRVDGVEALRALTECALENNALTEVPAAIGRLRALGELVLSDNAIQGLPEALPPNLRTLWCERNGLATLPASLPVSLVTLGLGGNRLAVLPDLAGLSALACLELRHNRLVALPDLGALERLETLYVDDNGLRELPKLPRSLKVLDAARNALTSATAADALPRLEELYLDDNRLAVAPAPGPELAALWLHGNPAGVSVSPPPAGKLRVYADVRIGDRGVAGAGDRRLRSRNFVSSTGAKHCVVGFAVRRLGEWGGVIHRSTGGAADAGFLFDTYRAGYADDAEGRVRSWLRGLAETHDTLSLVGSSQGAFGALRYASEATGSVLAFSPMRHDCNVDAVEWDATFRELPAAGGPKVTLYAARDRPSDLRAAREAARVLGPAATLVEVPSAGHGADALYPDRAALDALVRSALPG